MSKCGTAGGYYAHKKLGKVECVECKAYMCQRSKAYYHANKEKAKVAKKAWQKANLEKIRGYNRKAYAKNPQAALRKVHRRKARIRGNGYESYTLEQVLEKHGAMCHLCETPIDLMLPRKIGVEGWEYGLHLDHIVPLVNGGPDTLENVAPAHAICNLEKRGNECLKKVAI
jgi:5-methylcytosine-specific restriction endonuclease McrA